jgi:hypothetical protein
VKKLLFPLGACALAILFLGCLAQPVQKSGGPGSIVIQNTNANAIIAAANNVFPQYGYTSGPMSYPEWISFYKPSGTMGKILYGSYGTTTGIGVKLEMVSLGGGTYQVRTSVYRVSDAGQAGFQDQRKMIGGWAGQFKPLLQQIQSQAAGAGAM